MQPLATALAQELDPRAVDAERARRVVAAHPEDAVALAVLVRALPEGAERDGAVARLCKRSSARAVRVHAGAACPP